MKNTFLIFVFLSVITFCKAQVIGTLEQFEECSMRPNRNQEGCPDLENITYVKDTNNRLNQFVGTWKWGNQINGITLIMKKEDNVHLLGNNDNSTADVIVGFHKIYKSGTLTEDTAIYSNTNFVDKKNSFGLYFFLNY